MGRRAGSRRSISGAFGWVFLLCDGLDPPSAFVTRARVREGVVGDGGGDWVRAEAQRTRRGLWRVPKAQIGGFAKDAETKANKSGHSANAYKRTPARPLI